MAFIPYGRQWLGAEEIAAVEAVLGGDLLTTGPRVAEFERALAAYCGARYAVAVSSGTAALHLASLALLRPGDKVLTTPNSFLATANAILYAGARPLFVDIGKDGNLDLELCAERLRRDSRIKALYAVHFSGRPCAQEKLARLQAEFGVTILEDCAHSLGADCDGGRAGGCHHSRAAILSFHPVKNITTGEGGAITTNDEKLYRRLLRLRNHGIERKEFQNRKLALDENGRPNPWYYEMTELGFNYRITDIQCALGLVQLGKLDGFLARRRELAQGYDRAFAGHPAIRPLYPFDRRSAYHLYVVRIAFEQLSVTRAQLFERLRE